MANYQLILNKELSYTVLQNVTNSQDTEYSDFSCGMNDLSGDSVCNEIIMEKNNLHLKIIEEPADTFRYRYKSEKGSHGGIKGANTGRSKKSFPTVKLENCPSSLREQIVIKVSLYTNEYAPKPHVYELTGKNSPNGKDGGAKLDEDFMAVFQSLSISTRKKEEVLEILKERKKLEYGLAQTSYDEATLDAEAHEEMKTINLDSAILCFEAFSTDDINTPLCEAVFSKPINNQKSAATGDLRIVRLSECSGKWRGGDEVFLLCDKVKKDDIKVHFFEEDGDWEAYGEFNPAEIHHQVAIVFKTPEYRQTNIPKTVFIELFRPSDKRTSEPRKFEYRPEDNGLPSKFSEISRKRKRLNHEGDTEITEKFLKESSFMNSPQSIDDENVDNPDEPKFPFNYGELNLDEELQNFDIENPSNWSCLFEPVNEKLSEDLDKSQISELFKLEPLELLFGSLESVVAMDSLNQISSSMESLSLADQHFKQGLKKTKIQTAFVEGMKGILMKRDEGTYLYYANNLISLEDENGNSLLHLGIMEQSSNLDLFLKIIEMISEDDINHQNNFKETPLHLAVKGNHVKILLLLLIRGGNPNLTDSGGNNCLHLAAKYGHINCLKVLMPPFGNRRAWKHKIIDIDMLNYDGMSSLHLAVTGNFIDCVNFLLNSKADVNLAENKSGRTSLHLAIEHPSLLQAILKQPDVNIDAKDFRDYTAVQLACLKTGKSFEIVSDQLKDDKKEIIKFLENLFQDKGASFSDAKSDGESSDSSDFEDAVEDFSSISSNKVIYNATSTAKPMGMNAKKSSFMKTEEELNIYLDKNDNWKKLADLIGLDTKSIALLDEGASPGQTVIRKIKSLYHPCPLQTIIESLEIAGLEEGIRILQKT